MKLSVNSKCLIGNTGSLFFMTLSVQLLNLLTIPYLTRTLGPTTYGRIGLAQGYMSYVQIILDFGFILSATQIISENRENKTIASSVIASVTAIKVFLSILIIFAIFVLHQLDFFDSTNFIIISLYFVGNLLNALLPDYYYRGIEDMKWISIRVIVVRVLFTIMIFAFVKEQNDYYFIPLSFLLGSVVAYILSIIDIRVRYGIKMSLPCKKNIQELFKKSIPFFISRFASTFYQALDVIIIGKIYNTSSAVGLYSSSDKAITLSKMAASPIADSLYPYMIKNKDYKLVKKLLMICMPVITAGVIMVAIFARPLCILAFGKEYADADNILRLLLPIAWVILPTYVIAFPVMSPLGLVKYANRSNVIGMFVQLSGLVILKITGNLNVYTICGLTSLTEIIVFLYRLFIVIFRKKLNIGGE